MRREVADSSPRSAATSEEEQLHAAMAREILGADHDPMDTMALQGFAGEAEHAGPKGSRSRRARSDGGATLLESPELATSMRGATSMLPCYSSLFSRPLVQID